MRRSFEEKLRTFSQAQNQFEQEKKAALEELKAEHRQEIQELLRSHQSQNANYSKDQEKLVQLHKAEVTRSLLNDTVSNSKPQGRQKESGIAITAKLCATLLYLPLTS